MFRGDRTRIKIRMKVKAVKQVAVRLGKGGLENNRLAKSGNCLINLPGVFQQIGEIAVGLGKFWIKSNRLTIRGNGFIQPSFVFQGGAKVSIRIGEIGFENNGVPTRGQGFVQLSLVDQDIAKIAIGFGQVGIESDGPAKSRNSAVEFPLFVEGNSEVACKDRGSWDSGRWPDERRRSPRPPAPFFSRQFRGCHGSARRGWAWSRSHDDMRRSPRQKSPLSFQCIAKIIVGFGQVRLKCDCLTIGGNCLVQFPARFERIAQIATRLGQIGSQNDRPPNQIHGNVISPCLTGNHSQKMHRIGMDSAAAAKICRYSCSACGSRPA